MHGNRIRNQNRNRIQAPLHLRRRSVLREIINHFKPNTMTDFKVKDLSPKAKAAIAAKLVCLDAIENGACCADELTQYIKTPQFQAQVKGYMALISE